MVEGFNATQRELEILELRKEVSALKTNVEYWRLAAERRDTRKELTGLDVPEARTLDAPEPPQCEVQSETPPAPEYTAALVARLRNTDLIDDFARLDAADLIERLSAPAQAVPEPMIECPVCEGSGFSGRGTGYDDVCGECGGHGHYPAVAQAQIDPGVLSRLRRWRDVGDGPISYCAGGSDFAADVTKLVGAFDTTAVPSADCGSRLTFCETCDGNTMHRRASIVNGVQTFECQRCALSSTTCGGARE